MTKDKDKAWIAKGKKPAQEVPIRWVPINPRYSPTRNDY